MEWSNITASALPPTHQRYNIYQSLEVYFLRWYLPLVLLVGFLGGVFCIVFLFRSKLFPKNVLIWMVSICVGDLLILLFDALRMFLKASINYDIRDHSLVVCKLHNYFSQYFFFWSAYMQVCMSLQRVYFVWRPLRARVVLHWRKSALFWIAVSLLLAFPNMPFLLYWHIAPKNGDCEPVEKWYYYVTSVVDLMVGGVIPQLIMITCTCLIAVKICHLPIGTLHSPKSRPTSQVASSLQPLSRRKWFSCFWRRNSPAMVRSETIGESRRASNDYVTLEPVTETSIHHQIQSGTASRRNNRQAVGQKHGGKDNATHVTRLLLSMNAFFMITSFPLLIYLIHLNYGLGNGVGVTISKEMHKFFYYFLRSLCYLNSCSNWLFYCFAGHLFRRKARRILFQMCCPSRVESQFSSGSQKRPNTFIARTGASDGNSPLSGVERNKNSTESKFPLLSMKETSRPYTMHIQLESSSCEH